MAGYWEQVRKTPQASGAGGGIARNVKRATRTPSPRPFPATVLMGIDRKSVV